MNAKLKAKWITALRSGEYAQGSGKLKEKQEDGTYNYCCLGVLREVSPNTIKAATKGRSGVLTPASCGIDFEQQSTLAAMNDTGRSFKYIAAYIARRVA